MPYKIKTKQNETIVVSEAELFRLFLSKAKANEELKQKMDSFVEIYAEIIPSEAIINFPLADMMTSFFLLGYQFANFENKNEFEYEPIIKESKRDEST